MSHVHSIYIHTNIGLICGKCSNSNCGQGTEETTAVRLSTLRETQRTVSHKGSSYMNGQRAFHTGSNKMVSIATSEIAFHTGSNKMIFIQCVSQRRPWQVRGPIGSILAGPHSVPSPRGGLLGLSPKQSSKPPKLKHETL